MKKVLSIGLAMLAFFPMCVGAKELFVDSPNGKISVTVSIDSVIAWSACFADTEIIAPSEISMTFRNGEAIGRNPRLKKFSVEKVDEIIDAVIYKKREVIDRYNELKMQFRNYNLYFRAYDDGVAYRWETNFKSKEPVAVQSEKAEFCFAGEDHDVTVGYVRANEKDVYSQSFENEYRTINLKGMSDFWPAFAPILVGMPYGIKVAITDADLIDYPGMFLKKTGDTRLTGDFAPFVKKEVQGGHNNLQALVEERADYLAETTGKRFYPWRAVIIAEEDKDLLNSDMVYKLATPCQVDDVSWIKPGKLAWDYWCAWNIYGVDFRAGVNTETYKYFIDFASENKIEYVLLDEGWAMSTDIMTPVEDIDLPEIIEYAKRKNVSILLWAGWLPLDQKMDEVLKHYSDLGVKGFKVDFMDRDDQRVVNFCTRLAKKAAEYHLLIDLHGCYKPTGLQRTYPNVINFEGVYGLEYLKGDYPDMPRNDVTIPYLRMLAGPVDYTPGAMVNANRESYKGIWGTPMSQGTRAHQVALYVVFEAPLVMMADSPNNYRKEQETTDYIAQLPTVFDETVSLAGKVGEYAAVARRKGDKWYVGAITNWDKREISLDFSFLSQGLWKAEIFKDGINADRNGNDYKIEEQNIVSGKKLKVTMAPGGGWSAIISRIN